MARTMASIKHSKTNSSILDQDTMQAFISFNNL